MWSWVKRQPRKEERRLQREGGIGNRNDIREARGVGSGERFRELGEEGEHTFEGDWVGDFVGLPVGPLLGGLVGA